MKTKTHLSFLFSVVLFYATLSFAQDSSNHKHMHKHDIEMKKDTTGTGTIQETSIVREGEIDLAAIDKNKDGKVYQDQMCWNVISDKAGECPQCGMILKEVSLNKAKENLLKNDYKVK
jgi:hypothetical protein